MRIGHGYDVHRTKPGDGIVLGGVRIECDLALEAHSDGDVLTHALIDALFGAAGLPDIGVHFPDNNARYKDANSLELLEEAIRLVREEGFDVEFADMTVVAQSPKLAPFTVKMRETIAGALDISPSRVNVKATTEEKLGFTGSGEGISAHAVCLLEE
ncbi:MAG: 2-C-methyl-D-erythritol 2,4-cyclodiphosphate synthase [Clostridia bacterium]|nr:2-C-methyl-D-erythritol 2,4-cyclodiphosphate synthase [Clostridia bacterium]